MTDWWGVFHNSLWVLGLAVILAALGLAEYQAGRDGIRLRQRLLTSGFQLSFDVGLALFCLGLLLSSTAWWQQALWGLLAALFAGHAIWLWRRLPRFGGSQGQVSRKPSRKARWLGWGLVLVGLLLVGGWGILTGKQLYDRARSLKAHLDYLEGFAQGVAGGLGFSEVQGVGKHLSGMHGDLEAIQSQVGPLLPALRYLRWAPKHGGDLAAAADLLDVAVGVASAGDRTFQALSPALELVEGQGGDSDPRSILGEELLGTLVAARPDLQQAQQELEAVGQARARVDDERLSPQVAGLLERLDRYLPWFETAVDGGVLAPDLLGADGPRTYLILAQNNQELRATGGFISGVGELKVRDGQLDSLSFGDSYAVDNFEVAHDIPPLAFQQTLLGQMWLFRDTNWDANFPTSARRALDVYARDRGVQADGVIALDLTALELLLAALGPIQVEDFSEPVSGGNVLQMLQEQWASPSGGSSFGEDWDQEWWLHRKDFMGTIAGAALDKLLSGQDVNPVGLAQSLKQALDEKHILVYVDDYDAAALLRGRNWDGALPELPFASDMLLVVDSNVGFNKMDPMVTRSINYHVDLVGDVPQVRLSLTYENQSSQHVGECVQEAVYGEGYADMMERCYWDYVRVYVPPGSQLLAGPGLSLPRGSLLARNTEMEIQQAISATLVEGDWPVWSSFFDLAPGEEQVLTFEYQLPAEVVTRGADGTMHYRLLVKKQPGSEAVPVRVEFNLPPGAELLEAIPAGLPVVETDLGSDREFEIVFRTREGQR
jgi:hypothetical protein